MINLLCLHGFLGSSTDFDYLKADYHVFAPQLDQLVSLDYESLKEEILKSLPFYQYHILGYSFGARLAVRLFLDLKPQGKLICLGGHLGLKDISLREERKNIEQNFLKKLNQLTQKEFLDYWNSLPLFNRDQDLETANFSNASDFFVNYGLSKQPYLKSQLMDYKERVSIHYGEDDEKYKNYALAEISEFELQFWPKSSHRLIKNEELVKKILKDHI